MGTLKDEHGREYLFLPRDDTDIWIDLTERVTYGWDVPREVLEESFGWDQKGACMPGTCEDGLFSHWVEYAPDEPLQRMQDGLPKAHCRRRDECPLYDGGWGSCDGWAVASKDPSIEDIASWLAWDSIRQLRNALTPLATIDSPAVRRGVTCEYNVPGFWHLDNPTGLAAELVRRMTVVDDMIEIKPPEVSRTVVRLRLRPTKKFVDGARRIEDQNSQAPDETPETPRGSRWSGVLLFIMLFVALTALASCSQHTAWP